ncbi:MULTISPECIES: citrate lyase acyl carrier protein [Gilliamella]|jgi:citrate lyase acyl carrier protein|uniref:Citrate lyase acyl carrier protein n=2 Tax=Gilliamella TaxID=1193503 RepID=A0A556RNN2_9GAMM|nr:MULTISPECIES: citrate lyase acyl carrier protein [Gilliamella]KES16256.1 Citrate lyase, gamma subunit [Gilliamella apis SCGC AB-598-P17]MBI0038418.1 citrate lyase acyl carrier protein [Gilliamella sp. B14384G10]MBI0040285.1 citrate lyase acyl carrier protein [Gilliamella sp. B14384G7]MBI0052124.1 citrate lyase acyl carrier protein [Gilliamella sp. B14384G13]MBI0054705.1 citrate lyase acyl carrier protein [Gilliamella sp. B14384H2]
MKIQKEAMAGTLESSDLLVKVMPNTGIEIVINSDVNKQFGDQIRAVVNNTLNELNLTDGLIIIDDKGALDCAIKARVQCAVLRGAEETELDWSKLL